MRCVCSSCTWHRGNASHWCAGSPIPSSCCCSSFAPSGRGSWTQSGCTLHRHKHPKQTTSESRACISPSGVSCVTTWNTQSKLALFMLNKEANRVRAELTPFLCLPWPLLEVSVSRSLCCTEPVWVQAPFSGSLGWLMTPGTDGGLSQICLTHPVISNVR